MTYEQEKMVSAKDYGAQVDREETKVARWLLFGILAVIICFFTWAIISEIETMTRATGKIIPSGKNKTVQHFEGGIVHDILVQEGDLVTAGQPIIVIDNTRAESELKSVETQLNFGLGKIARLNALIALASGELDNTGPTFPSNLPEEIVFQEQVAFDSAKAEFEANMIEFDKKIDQRGQRKNSIFQELNLREQQIALLTRTINAYQNLKGARAVSQLELEEKENQLIETRLTIANLRSQIPILESETKELNAQRNKYIQAFRYDAVQELSTVKEETQSMSGIIKDRAGALSRTQIISPIDGEVNQLFVSGRGEVISPGGEVAEIVPIEDQFIAEVLIAPSDIGFIEVGQTAKIKITAFDSARYGSLTGQITSISSDTIADQQRENQEFYRVLASTEEVLRDREGNILRYGPGMTVQVDIVTGKKTVAEYIMLPIMRGLEGSVR